MMVFGIIALGLGVVGLVAHYYPPGSLYTLALAAGSVYLSLGALVAVVSFILVRSPAGWVGAAVSAAIVVWLVALHAPDYVAASVPSTGTNVVVMTSNLKVGAADPSALVAAVRSHHVDVLMLEELTPDARRALQHAGLDALLPHSVSDPRAGGSGTGLWSRHPLTDARTSNAFGFAFVTARTDVGGEPVSLAAVHVYGPSPQPKFGAWQSDMSRYPTVLQDLPDHTTLIGGDFNATPDTAQFRTILRRGFNDAADQAGAGFTPTWPADRWYPPLISIDHVLTRGAVARSLDSIEIPGSDHRALVATVLVPTR